MQPLGTLAPSNQEDSAPHAHSVNSANLSEWMGLSTIALDDPRMWDILPPVQHAHGCEQYADVAAAAVGLQQQQQQEAQDHQQQLQQQAAEAGGAHEAGFDAFMTGMVFLGLLRLYEVAGKQGNAQRTRFQVHHLPCMVWSLPLLVLWPLALQQCVSKLSLVPQSTFVHVASALLTAKYAALTSTLPFIFVVLLCLAALGSLSRWMLPSAPPLPPQLDNVSELSNRQYHAKSKDIPYAALQGKELMPQRPQVVYVGTLR